MTQQLTGLDKKKVLITGASGFIGSYLSHYFLKIGAEVHATSRSERTSNKKNLVWWKVSPEDISGTRKLLKTVKPDLIYHFSGEVTAANDLKFVLPTYHSLLTSTVNLLTVATEVGCEKIILTGSSTEPLENMASPNSPYAAAKLGTNFYGHMFREIYKSPIVIVRPFMGYGPGQNKHKVIPYVISSFLKDEAPKLTNGNWKTDWIFIKDLVEGILCATVSDKILGKTIDLGTGVITSVTDIISKIEYIMQTSVKPQFGALPDRFDEHTRKADTIDTFEEINWKAKTTLDEGLKITVDWFRKKAQGAHETNESLDELELLAG